MTIPKPQLNVKKSYKDGHVSIKFEIKSRRWNAQDLLVKGGVDITTEHARDLAALLIQYADNADSKTLAKKKSEENRQKYREREIAAGRMVVIHNLQ